MEPGELGAPCAEEWAWLPSVQVSLQDLPVNAPPLIMTVLLYAPKILLWRWKAYVAAGRSRLLRSQQYACAWSSSWGSAKWGTCGLCAAGGWGAGAAPAGGARLSSATCAAVTGPACSAAGAAGDKRTSWNCSRPPAPLPAEAKPRVQGASAPTLRDFNNNGHNCRRV